MTNENMFSIATNSAEETKRCGAVLASALQPGDVVVLSGDLGAGKTQFVQGVARGLGISDAVTSPTFNILLEYEGRLPLYHFDLYRLEDPGQLEDIDFYGVVEGDGASLIEWGEKFPEEMPEDRLEVAITTDIEGARTIAVNARGERASQLATAWWRALKGEGDERDE
jgi:tRNA threonylcarbamoyladenosine biosynthesis protein TsaE